MNRSCKGRIGAVLTVVFFVASVTADSKRPTCEEEPGLRDCVKVEDPDAQPPAPSVYRQKKPTHPIAKPAPASAGSPRH